LADVHKTGNIGLLQSNQFHRD